MTTTENGPSGPNWNPEIEPFLAAAARGTLLVGHCRDCGQYHFYPRSMCPFCHGTNTLSRPSAGRGHVYSYSIQRRVPEPYVIAYVTLDEGPTLMTHIVGPAVLESVHVGQPVELAFRDETNGARTPVFRPIASGSSNTR
ncbi:MAG: Zn-ribbon domain-containing OB-fold protein [Bradyrhizobium sp.]|jgi:uncharacterized protein|uniref:Zn-ribbon domain-containing OB-fold protein n=1 Tax=Bradyrhizobium sp. TaxID=376 RepID=UPI003D0DD153